jgi:3-deoxy-D-manno-octulosonic-acid transferase
LTLLLLDLIYLLILVLGLPYAVYKTVTSTRFRAGWRHRFGGVPDLRSERRVWLHCASVGEALLIRSLVTRIESECPGADIVLSTNTNTGLETIETHLPGHTAFYFPLDFSPVVRKVFRRIKPSTVILVELEIWPNFLAVARRRRVPVVVVNGRITERSARRYRRFGPLARQVFDRVDHFAVQNREYADRLKKLGVASGRISVVGTMKYDTVATEVPEDAIARDREALRLAPDDTVILGGCTHPGEDESLIDYVKRRPERRLRLILAPRHRERADAVEALIRGAGLCAVRKTAVDASRAPDEFERHPHVLLLDTTGELARLYAVADVAFVGGSLIPHGGQNMIEPAALGRPVVVGPHTWNFRETVGMLADADAIVQVDHAKELAPALDALLDDPRRRDAIGRRARRLVEEHKGATLRNFRVIEPFLNLCEKET